MCLSFFIFGGGNMARTNNNRSEQNNACEVLSYAEQVEELFLDLYAQYDVANAPEKKRANIIDTFWKDIYNQYNLKSKIKPYDVNTIESIIDVFVMLCNRYGGVILIDSFCNLIGYSRSIVYLWNQKNTSNRYIFTLTDNDIQEEYNNNIYINYSIDYDNNIIECINNNNNIYINKDNEKASVLTSWRLDVVKKLREEEQKQSKLHLSNSDIGMIFRSNNEDELGLKYDAKRTIEQEQIKQIATAGQLPVFNKLSENNTQFITKNE